MNKISVMIVEDHELTRGGLQMVIAQEPDMEVIGAYGNSDEGLQHAQNKRPEVILLDLHLPGASGACDYGQVILQHPRREGNYLFRGESPGLYRHHHAAGSGRLPPEVRKHCHRP